MYYTSNWPGYSKRIALLPSLLSAKQFGNFRGDNFALNYTLKLVKKCKTNAWKWKVSHKAFEGVGWWRAWKKNSILLHLSLTNFAACCWSWSLWEFAFLSFLSKLDCENYILKSFISSVKTIHLEVSHIKCVNIFHELFYLKISKVYVKDSFAFDFKLLKHKPSLLRSSLLKYGKGFLLFSNNLIEVSLPCWVHLEVKKKLYRIYYWSFLVEHQQW